MKKNLLFNHDHWVYRSVAKSAHETMSKPISIRNNKELYNFSEKYVPKEHGNLSFVYNYIDIKECAIETSEWNLKLLEKKSGLPIKTKADKTSKTLHLLESICSLHFEGDKLTASTNYHHKNPDKWTFE